MRFYIGSILALIGAMFVAVPETKVPPLQVPQEQQVVTLGQEPSQAEVALNTELKQYINANSHLVEPVQSGAATPPLIDPDQLSALNSRFDSLEQKIDALANRPEATRALFPTSDEIAMRVTERLAVPLAEKVAEKVTEKVVEKIKGFMLEFKSADGSTRTQTVPISNLRGSPSFNLAPGESLVAIDGVPVQQTRAAPLANAGWTPSAPVAQTEFFQVQSVAPRQMRIVPRVFAPRFGSSQCANGNCPQ